MLVFGGIFVLSAIIVDFVPPPRGSTCHIYIRLRRPIRTRMEDASFPHVAQQPKMSFVFFGNRIEPLSKRAYRIEKELT